MNQTYPRVVSVLADSLGVEPEDISLDSHLLTDLGADSLDMLDVTFKLEQVFGVRLERERLFPDWLFYGESEYVSGGRLTFPGATRVHDEFPFLPQVSAGVEAKSLLTVRLLTGIIAQVVSQSKQAA